MFFSVVDAQQIKNTRCLTSMLNTKTQIQQFAKEHEDNIRSVAASPYLRQISSMCNGRGIPTAEEVNDFVGLAVFKGEGEGYCLLFLPCVVAVDTHSQGGE